MKALDPHPERTRQPAFILEAIAVGNRFHFRGRNPWLHNLLNVGLALALVALIAGVLAAAPRVHWAVYLPLAGFALGVLFFSLIILVVHEASHGMFVVSRIRARAATGNRVAGWLVSVPFAINYARHWEEGHRIHHDRPQAPDDPQSEVLYTGPRLIWMLVRMLFIPGYVFLWNPSRKYRTHRFLPFANALFWIMVGTASARLFGGSSLGALLLGFQVLGTLNQLKISMEHGGEIGHEENRNFRSRTSLFPLRWLIMPFNISIHFEHHLNQSVPWYALMRYHRAILDIVPEAVQRDLFNEHVRDQLLGRRGGLSPAAREAAGLAPSP